MDFYILIFGLCLCALTTSVFLYFRVKRGGVVALLTKAIASFCFVVFALFLSTTKTQVAYYGSYAITCLIVGLVASLIGDILLDLKVMYPFHESKFLTGGTVSFLVAHIFNVSSVLLLANNEISLTEILVPALIIVGACAIATLVAWVILTKAFKFNFKKHTAITCIYTFVLLVLTAITTYLSFKGLTPPLFILTIGFVLFLVSNVILSAQYFGKKKEDKTLTVANHICYYLAQMVIAAFIFFI